jgi:hypothetical protein
MATNVPYLLFLSASLSAGGQGTMTYQVPPNQSIEIDEFTFISTGTFKVVGIRNGGGIQFTNATPTNGILSTQLANGANNFNVIKDFKPNLIVQGGDSLYIDVLDTSTLANVVSFLANCNKVQQ